MLVPHSCNQTALYVTLAFSLSSWRVRSFAMALLSWSSGCVLHALCSCVRACGLVPLFCSLGYLVLTCGSPPSPFLSLRACSSPDTFFSLGFSWPCFIALIYTLSPFISQQLSYSCGSFRVLISLVGCSEFLVRTSESYGACWDNLLFLSCICWSELLFASYH